MTLLKFDISDDRIRAIIPNVMRSTPQTKRDADSLSSLSSRLAPFIDSSWMWLGEWTGETIPDVCASDTSIQDAITRFITLHAFASAIPSLNLILTPNGFATAGTDTIVPASKARTDDLMAGLQAQSRMALHALLRALQGYPEFRETVAGSSISCTLFAGLNLFATPGKICAPEDFYIRLDAVARAERRLADRWLSPELLAALRRESFDAIRSGKWSPRLAIANRIRLIVDLAVDGTLSLSDILPVVETVRTSDCCPEFATSKTAQILSDEGLFKNSHGSSAFWF